MQISIIIPVINEAETISESISRAWLAGADEVLVVDGGSNDGTIELARQHKCRLIASTLGRGQQLNAGAAVGNADTLLFLHADNWLPTDACLQIREEHKESQDFWGGFHQRIENSQRKYRWLESGNAFRVRWQGLVYGDQALFISRSLFEKAGGFPNQSLMEDFEISKRLRKLAWPVLLPGPVHVSARRWEQNGVVRQTIKNWGLTLAYRLGRSPEKLRQQY